MENTCDPAHSSGPCRDLLESLALSGLEDQQKNRRGVDCRRQAPGDQSPDESSPKDRPGRVQGSHDDYRGRRTSQGASHIPRSQPKKALCHHEEQWNRAD